MRSVGGIDLQCGCEQASSAGKVPTLAKDGAQVGVCARVLRVCSDGGAPGSPGASLVPATVQESAQVGVRVRVLWVCGDGGAVGSPGTSLVSALL